MMQKSIRYAFITLVLAAMTSLAFPAFGDTLTISVPATVHGQIGDLIKIQATTTGKNVEWITCDSSGLVLFPTTLLKDNHTAIVVGKAIGTYRLIAITCAGDVLSSPAVCTVTIGTPTPPVPPVPPGPPTPPVPPSPPSPPVPPPNPPPIPVVGFRVLIVYDSTRLAQMPAAQQNILFSRSFRNLLNTTCAPGTDGKTKEWRIFPAGTDTSKESTMWQDAMKRPRASLPWIMISDGKTGYEGPLPANVNDATALIKKYSGSSTRSKHRQHSKGCRTESNLPMIRRISGERVLPIRQYRKGA